MSWDAIAAIGSIAGALILAIASVAAIVQLKHLRLANQLDSYAHFTETTQSPEIIEARTYLSTHDFSDPAALKAATVPQLDPRIAAIGAHFQIVCRLLNLGILDERMFAFYISMAPEVWGKLKPIAHVLREREDTPRWGDIEYLVYRASVRKSLTRLKRDYDPEFLIVTGLGKSIDQNQARLDELADFRRPGSGTDSAAR